MPVTIKVNGRSNSLIHKGSNGLAKCTVPDVCKTPSPGGPVPIPYPVIISMSSDLANGSTTVKADGGNMIAIKGCEFSRCTGDEAGTAGGVKSSTFGKEAKFILYSFDVKIDGQNACRLGDKMTMNHENTVCLGGPTQQDVVVEDEEEKCPQCGGSHPGLKPGDSVPEGTELRRGIPADKVKPDGSISKSAFKDTEMSVDIAATGSVDQMLAAPHLAGGKTVEFTAKEAKEAFPDNEVVFACVPGNPSHCEVRGKKTDGQCNQFAKKLASRLK